MIHYVTHRSASNEFVRLKKSLQFIEEVVKSYETGAFAHLGFSCALAISKAEEWRDRVSPFCPASVLLADLADALRALYEGKETWREARKYLKGIHDYFGLSRYSLVRRERVKV